MASEKSSVLYNALLGKGIPDELCREIAYKYMNTDYTANRMLGYLYRITEPSVEMVVDEMIAILEDRNRFMKKQEMEKAQASINKFYSYLSRKRSGMGGLK